jgi:uncharacterized protein (DUF433 family)
VGYSPQSKKGCSTNVMAALDRITFDPTRTNGQACIRELRLTVRRVVEALAVYSDRAELKREYPELEDEDIRQALAYAAANLEDEALDLPASRWGTSSTEASPRSTADLLRR